MAVSEQELLEAAKRVVDLAAERGVEIGEAASAKAVYDKEHGDAVVKDAELAAAFTDFQTKAAGYQLPAGDIP